MINQKPTPPMTADMVAQHLTMLQAKQASPLISASPQPLPRSSFKESFVSWIGLRGKTLWDWISIVLIPVILAIYTLTAMQQQNSIADEQLKSQILQNYTSLIQDLILHEGLLQSKEGDNVRIIARTQTDLAFRQLDKNREARLLLFISQLNLTDTSNPFIDLKQLDFSETDLSGVYLTSANLSRAYLTSAKLSRAYLINANLSGVYFFGASLSEAHLTGANLSGAYLSNADLSGASLMEANLSGADLYGANLSGADLYGANLSGADLTKAVITNEQLQQAKSLQGATMPNGSIHH